MWSNYWPKDLATYQPKAVSKWHEEHVKETEVHKVIQYFFFSQWKKLKEYANSKGISIVGDIPIFVASDSADVWANQKLFQLDSEGKSTAVAGVPPDYFSATGQLWGNPLYDWDAMKKTGYKWWIDRIRAMLSVVDFVRIDHFRGFEAYWSVPAGEETAINGKWVPGPDHALFNKIKEELGDIPVIAEDLGVITDGVAALRDDFELPGMKVLQFAFDVNEEKAGALTNAFLPHEYGSNFVVYTGTHDNETMQGWLNSAKPEERDLIRKYLGACTPGVTISDDQLCPALIRAAFASVAKFAVIPMQDIFAIGSEGRMNVPSTTGGINWQWRMTPEMFSAEKALWLKEMSVLYGRN
jgi:4-alpha-glucanotransferase